MKALLIIVGSILFIWGAVEFIGALAAVPAWAWAMYLLVGGMRSSQSSQQCDRRAS